MEFSFPFRYWIIDNFVSAPWPQYLNGEIPPLECPKWVRYDNDCERRKRACNDLGTLDSYGFLTVLNRLIDPSVVTEMCHLSGISELRPDYTWHGAGLHVTDPGGYLQPHIDYALHPNLPSMERRLNLILFLNRRWLEGWGGALEFYDRRGDIVLKRIFPAFNRAVIWEPTGTSFHGTQYVSEDAPPRVTLAVYYLTPARPGTDRLRALYVPRR